MKRTTLLFFLIAQLSFGNALWSKKGHRTIGLIAENHLTKRARKAVDMILNGENLASVATFADEIKADRNYRQFSAWHYVNFPFDKKYGDEKPSPYGDLIVGIEKCIEIIKKDNSPKADKAFYLKMLVHLLGDLHQPMHVGKKEDKGGNDIQVVWFGKGSNLHRLWDLNMIDDHGMSYTELAASLPKRSKAQKKAIQQGTIYDWIAESQGVAIELYGSVEVGEKLSYKYSYTWWGTVEAQLQKGGLRLAAVLNDVFK